MQDYLKQLLAASPQEQAIWAEEMAKHQPPPGDFLLGRQQTNPEIARAAPPAMPPPPGMGDFGGLVNPPPLTATQAAGASAPAAAYMAPVPVGFTQEQLHSLAVQGQRTPVPHMPAPAGVHSQQTAALGAAPNAAGAGGGTQSASTPAVVRGAVAPRASLAQLLGR